MFQKITRKNLETFLETQASNKKTLDVGSGGSLYDYARFFPNRTTVDIDPTRNPEIIGDIHNLPFANEEFDIVLCLEVLEHVVDPQQAIKELRRVLKANGVLILSTRFIYPIHDAPTDYWRFTEFGLRELFKDWHVQELIRETRTFSTIAVLFQRIAYQTTLRLNIFMKIKCLVLAVILNRLNWLLQIEYGDIKHTNVVEGILSSGYYLIARK